jgi:signal transduction histidine kinase
MQERSGPSFPARKWAPLLLVSSTAVGLLIFGHKYLDSPNVGEPSHFWETLIDEMTGAYTAAALVPFAVLFARRYPLDRPRWARRLPAHALAVVVGSAAHTTLMTLSRSVLFPLAGLGPYDPGYLPVRYGLEFFNDVLAYGILVVLVAMWDRYAELRRREVRAAQLEARLSQAQLEALRLQLEPHFLFNTLNTISSVVYEDPRAADEMISRLSDLLRALLRAPGAQEVTLEEELRFLGLYLELMRARFADRLAVEFEVEPAARAAYVPYMLLQPLVENALRHGADPDTARVDVEVRARRDGGALVLEVRDHGPGPGAGGRPGQGIGIANTAGRIAQLYGPGYGLSLNEADGGGTLAAATLPFRTAAAAAV